MEEVGIECRFDADGAVHVRRIDRRDRWESVEQGRQWVDELGRHVLVMIEGGDVQRLTLDRESLLWRLEPSPRPRVV